MIETEQGVYLRGYQIVQPEKAARHRITAKQVRAAMENIIRKLSERFTSDIVVLDAGRYGFVELQYFRAETGFNSVMVFDDSRKLFDDLWESWMNVQLLKIVSGTPMEEKDYEDIFEWLPKDKQEEILAKQKVFASRARVRQRRGGGNGTQIIKKR